MLEDILGVNFEQILTIFSIKSVEKVEAIKRGHEKVGRTDGDFLESKVSSPDHNFLVFF